MGDKVKQLEGLWNKHAACTLPFSTVCVINKKRTELSMARLKEKPDLHYWRCLFDAIKWLPALCGDNPDRFVVQFDWIIRNPTNHITVREAIKEENKKRLKNNFEYELKEGGLDYLKGYLLPNERLEDLPLCGVNLPKKNGTLDEECIEWASKVIQRVKNCRIQKIPKKGTP